MISKLQVHHRPRPRLSTNTCVHDSEAATERRLPLVPLRFAQSGIRPRPKQTRAAGLTSAASQSEKEVVASLAPMFLSLERIDVERIVNRNDGDRAKSLQDLLLQQASAKPECEPDLRVPAQAHLRPVPPAQGSRRRRNPNPQRLNFTHPAVSV